MEQNLVNIYYESHSLYIKCYRTKLIRKEKLMWTIACVLPWFMIFSPKRTCTKMFNKRRLNFDLLWSSWKIGFSLKRHHLLKIGAIRFPVTFFNSNILPWDEKKAKLKEFIELALLEFGCPGMTHITNFTRIPLHMVSSNICHNINIARIANAV